VRGNTALGFAGGAQGSRLCRTAHQLHRPRPCYCARTGGRRCCGTALPPTAARTAGCGPTPRRSRGARSAARPPPPRPFVPWAARRPLRKTSGSKPFSGGKPSSGGKNGWRCGWSGGRGVDGQCLTESTARTTVWAEVLLLGASSCDGDLAAKARRCVLAMCFLVTDLYVYGIV
jgi:hypothetical protein